MRRRVWTLAIGLAAVFAAWFTVRAVESWRFKAELRQAQLDLSARRFGPARARLSRLAQRWPDHGEVEYLLGACEMAKGHTDAAMAAWGRVPDQAPQAPVALLSRGRLALDTGHYGLAETCLDRASRMGGDHANEARRLLARVHWITGRHDEYRSFLRREFDHTRDPYETLRVLWSLDHEPYPIEGMRQTLEKARLIAPDDDRVWLALAGLATRSGRVDEAGELLARCERVQPDDSAVWRARLEWAQAANRPDELMRAAKHLPASGVPKGQLLTISAWLAARRGDRRAEREALEQLVDLEPEQAAGFERLADLATQDGAMARFAELRRRKAESDSARDRYATLVHQLDPAPPAAELARTAEALGRRFDAQAWWKLAARRDQASRGEAEAALARLAKAEPESAPVGRTLGDLLGPLPTPRNGKTDVPVALSVPAFTDDAERRGLAFIFDNGRTDLRQLPETMSGGVALLDFDGDGWLDIYAVGGGPFPPAADRPLFGDRLFRNRGDGRFEDVTAASGLAALSGGYGHGVAVGDYDNDGRPDLFVTRWRSYALYHNLGAGRFEDTTASAGLGGDRDWPTSAAWADFDGDGDLDLYVCHYLDWHTESPQLCRDSSNHSYQYCNPRSFAARPDHLFRNDGGRFVDVTAEAGIVDHDGRGLGVVAADLDRDGLIDLFVANDTTANFLFRNCGGLRFEEVGISAGAATNANGGYQAGMGVACGDLDGDGLPDLAVTNFYGESTTFYRNLGSGNFGDHTVAIGLASPSRYRLGFGVAMLDVDNDGRLDVATANGHVEDFRPLIPYAMPAQLLIMAANGRLVDASDSAGAPWSVPRVGRGLAAGDLDNDGRVDLVLVGQGEPLSYFHNQSAAGHFLTLCLEGTNSNRDAVGACVAVVAAGRRHEAARIGGGSYQSASDPRLHFGLGLNQRVELVEVRWPSGGVDRYRGLKDDCCYRLREGQVEAELMTGWGWSE